MNRFDRKAWKAGLTAAFTVAAGIYVGSHGLKHFDPAVIWYAIGSILAAFAVAYRFTIWAQRPPSRLYFKRGFQILRRRIKLERNFLEVGNFWRRRKGGVQAREGLILHTAVLPNPKMEAGRSLATNFVAQNFIRRRSWYRWIMHLCLSGGCTLAFAITFPLVFGWVHFQSLADNAEIYRVHVFGLAIDQFHIHSAKAFVAFNLLNFAAVIVLIGLVMAAGRRLTDAGERATQKFVEDILPLILIFAVTATGLMLTISYKFMAGRGHSVVAIIHMITVVALLFYIPFGKLFHMFQRTCALCVSLYKKAGVDAARAECLRCGEDFASQMHVDDLKLVLDQLGFNYRFATPEGEIHFQDICPSCRRRLLSINQGRTVGR